MLWTLSPAIAMARRIDELLLPHSCMANRYPASISSYLFTLASMATLRGRICLSCNIVHIGCSFNRILFNWQYSSYKPQCPGSIQSTQLGVLKVRSTTWRGSNFLFFGELHNRYAINSSFNNSHVPNATNDPHQRISSSKLTLYWIKECILII
jgi:hypothetical protein